MYIKAGQKQIYFFNLKFRENIIRNDEKTKT